VIIVGKLNSNLIIHLTFKSGDNAMYYSIHYYVLLLGKTSNKLFEGFRDTLIEIKSDCFPVDTPTITAKPKQQEKLLKEFYRDVDQFFAAFYNQDPLCLVLVGETMNRSIFRSVSVHNKDIIGGLEGNYEATSVHDLGQIVWPIVREALSGNRERALRELDEAVKTQKVVSGLDQVWRLANSETGSALLVEEDYHKKGSIVKTAQSWTIVEQVDIREVLDDVVDKVIEKVLKMGGTVVFLENGSLAANNRIALIPRG
jgi:hypothetical protein